MMFDTFLHYAAEIITFIVALIGDNPWLTILVALATVFSLLAWKSNKTERLNWTDILTDDGPSDRVSLTKVLQLVGGVVATWMMVYLTVHNKASADFFMIYLAYVGAIEGWRNFVATRWGGIGASAAPASKVPPAAPQVTDTEMDTALDQTVQKPTGSKAPQKTRGSK